MTDNQFNVLDELYFVRSFSELLENMEMPEREVVKTLQSLHSNGWIKVLQSVDDEVVGEVNWGDHKKLYFLASKSGLMAHNTI